MASSNLWIKLTAVELLGVSSIWIALLVLSVQGRLSYLLQEKELNYRQAGRCQPEIDLFRRVRLWSAVALLGAVFSLAAMLRISENTASVFLNLGSLFVALAFLLVFVAYARYLFTTYVVDYFATTMKIEPIHLIAKEVEDIITNKKTNNPKKRKDISFGEDD